MGSGKENLRFAERGEVCDCRPKPTEALGWADWSWNPQPVEEGSTAFTMALCGFVEDAVMKMLTGGRWVREEVK